MIDARTNGSSTSSTSARELGRVVHLEPFAVALEHPVRDVRRRHEQVEVELALEPLADDLHVQQAEEAATEPEAESLRRLRLVEQRAVVQLQPLQRVAQLRILVGIRREESREHHRLHVLVARERIGRATCNRSQRVADAQTREILQPGDHVADLARRQRLDRRHRRREETELLRIETRSGRHRLQRLTTRERAVDHPDEREHAAVLVVRRVEDERARRRIRSAGRRRNALDDRIEDVADVLAGLRRDADDLRRIFAEQVGNLDRCSVRIRLRQIDLVHHGHDLEPVLDREIRVREGLRLDPLRGVDDEQRALARLERAGHLVGEVHVTRRVDQVELVALPAHPHRLGLDRDPALALELHRVEQLRPHVARRHGVGQLENAVGERRLAVVDVRDDREVSDPALVHGLGGDGTRRAVSAGFGGPARVGSAAIQPKGVHHADLCDPAPRRLALPGGAAGGSCALRPGRRRGDVRRHPLDPLVRDAGERGRSRNRLHLPGVEPGEDPRARVPRRSSGDRDHRGRGHRHRPPGSRRDA